MDTFEAIGGDMLRLLDEYHFWVIGLDADGNPRTGFTPEECQARLAAMPPKGKLDELRAELEQAKPRCDVCGGPSQFYVTDVTYQRDQKALFVRRTIQETIFYCETHRRETVSRYEDYDDQG